MGSAFFVLHFSSTSLFDMSVVQVDGAYCGIVYKPVNASDGDMMNDVDLGKIRLMRKDDLVVISSNDKTPRCPENFQKQLQKIPLPGGISAKKMHSLTIDNIGMLVSI